MGNSQKQTDFSGLNNLRKYTQALEKRKESHLLKRFNSSSYSKISRILNQWDARVGMFLEGSPIADQAAELALHEKKEEKQLGRNKQLKHQMELITALLCSLTPHESQVNEKNSTSNKQEKITNASTKHTLKQLRDNECPLMIYLRYYKRIWELDNNEKIRMGVLSKRGQSNGNLSIDNQINNLNELEITPNHHAQRKLGSGVEFRRNRTQEQPEEFKGNCSLI